MSSGDAPFSLNLALPKADQYDPTETLTIRGDTFEELGTRAVAAGLDFPAIMARLRLKQALGASVDPTPVTAATPVPAATPAAVDTTPSSEGTCPVHNVPWKPTNRRDRKGAFLACGVGYNKCKESGGPGAKEGAESLKYDPAYDQR